MKTDMRVVVTKRMLRDGLLRCMETTPVSRITVSDLCRESGINRATFYNHYDTPVMILREIARSYADRLSQIYEENLDTQNQNDDAALEACLAYISEHKAEIRVLFSPNTEQFLAGFYMDILNEMVLKQELYDKNPAVSHEEQLLYAATTASAIYGFIQIWITMNIDKTPAELVKILKKVLRNNVFI